MRLHQHRVESLLARSLSEFCEERDIAAKHRLQRSAGGPENRSRSDDDTTNDAEVIDDAEPGHVEAGRRHVGRNVCYLRIDDGRHESSFALSCKLSKLPSLQRPREFSHLNFTFAISSFGVNSSPKSSTSISLRISISPF